jgi:D-glycero-alpha-D-manno-heptose-7-phosphate kinase
MDIGDVMIISRTPFRVSLFGGGTDYPSWYQENGGAVLGFAINRYCYITLRYLPPFFNYRHRIVYSRIETVAELKDIEHPAVRAVLGEMAVEEGLEIHHDGDLPARSGLGSSSSFTVGLLNAINALRGQMMGKQALACEAIRIEQNVIKENVGSQDQIWAAYGGFNRIEFNHQGFRVSPIIVPEQRSRDLLDHLVLYFTGFSRIANEVAKKKLENFSNRRPQLTRMHAMVDEAVGILADCNRPITEIGELLHEAWLLKRGLSPVVSTDAIDEIYNAGRAAGAVGGKLLGAGSGGFFLFFIAPERRPALREALSSLIEVSIDIDRDGSSIVLFEPNGFHRGYSPLRRMSDAA